MTGQGWQQITACAETNARESGSRALIIAQNTFGYVSVMWQLCNDYIGAKTAIQTGLFEKWAERDQGGDAGGRSRGERVSHPCKGFKETRGKCKYNLRKSEPLPP